MITSGTTKNNKWQHVVQRVATSYNEWQRVAQRMTTTARTNESEWRRMRVILGLRMKQLFNV